MPELSRRHAFRVAIIPAAIVVFLGLSWTGSAQAQDRGSAARSQPRSAYKTVGWDLLAGFQLDPFASSSATTRAIPPGVKALDSNQVMIGGYMLPFEFGGKGVTYFALTESLDTCGFGELLTPTNWIATAMPAGKWATYHEFMYVQVFGKMSVAPYYQDGQLSNIYYLLADSVRIAR